MQNNFPSLISKNIDGLLVFKLIDNNDQILKKASVVKVIKNYKTIFYNFDEMLIDSNASYVSIKQFIDKLIHKLKRKSSDLLIDEKVSSFLTQKNYDMENHRTAGETIKNYDHRWNSEVQHFKEVVSSEIERPLKDEQIQASFFLAKMKRAANFSVPGTGKTATMYGAYAYLSSPSQDKVNKLLVVCPLNAFESWRYEYEAVFGNKRKLHYMNLKDKVYNDFGRIRSDWGIANLVVINYEGLPKVVHVLNELVDEQTMIVFDEVHRIKGVNGSRAKVALELGDKTNYRYVLTGTPIPNGYEDIYNFLNILFKDEYDDYFKWQVNDLKSVNAEDVTDKLYPFFWRTTKKDLNVPLADQDQLISVEPTQAQADLARLIYQNEPGILAIYIRLIQASTNPALILKKLDYAELGMLDLVDSNINMSSALNEQEKEFARQKAYQEMNVLEMKSPKFEKGIELVSQLVEQGKKVLVWGMFVDTMHKIQYELNKIGIKSNLVYGGTPKEDRVSLIDQFRDSKSGVDVLISNPNTLGESISLHQTVHDAVYFEYNFNLTFMLQSRDRIHRLGLPENQYTRYYYLETLGDRAHHGYIDHMIYERLKEKEQVMLDAIEGDLLVPEYTDDYLEEVKRIIDGH